MCDGARGFTAGGGFFRPAGTGRVISSEKGTADSGRLRRSDEPRFVLVLQETVGGRVFPCLLSSVVTAAYVECLARILKVPATILLLPAIATSAPGRLLYSAMRSLVEGKYRLAWEHGVTAARYSLAVAAGISLVWAAFMTAGALTEYRKKRL